MQRHDGTRAGALAALAERSPAAAALLAGAPQAVADSLAAVLAASDFVLDALCRDETLCQQLIARAPSLFAGEPLPLPALGAEAVSEDAASEAHFMAVLRRWRRAEFTRIAWRDLAGWASLDETMADLSRAADLALRLAHDFAVGALAARYGRPRSAQRELPQLIIVAMGKLGGGELNFSSDIDLVLLYPGGAGSDDARQISDQDYFTRLGQALIRLLGQLTADGFVFRVDLRLRPFGDSGPLVSSAAALEDYLQLQGRDWERYAWVKARPVTNGEAYAELFRSAIQPFVYRRYLDFGIFESLREMKTLIEREVQRRDLADNIKLGDGGIREIEFIVQSFQLIRGGQDRHLQGSSLRRALPLLAGAKLLPPVAVAELDAAYQFLRRVENRLQMRADQQVHKLPTDALERERLAASLKFASWSLLHADMEHHRGRVAAHFRAMLSGAAPAHAALPRPLPPSPLLQLDQHGDLQGLSDWLAAAG